MVLERFVLLSTWSFILPKNPTVAAIIPARYASTRFPGKPLALIKGKPMIEWVYQQAQSANCFDEICVATDHEEIYTTVEQFGGNVKRTSEDCPSGSDRVWEVAQSFAPDTIIFNIQGDEPFINPLHLQALAKTFQAPINQHFDIGTLVCPITDKTEFENPNVVKAACNATQVFYFSRSPIPYHRDEETCTAWGNRHIGIYAYRYNALKQFVALPQSPLEITEKLEQLRALEAGMQFLSVCVDKAPIGVDTPDDLKRLEDENLAEIQ